MTQEERIMDYMRKNGSITPFEAFSYLGCTKLATRISNMRKNGINIRKTPVRQKNRYGEPVRFMSYSLEDNNGCQMD